MSESDNLSDLHKFTLDGDSGPFVVETTRTRILDELKAKLFKEYLESLTEEERNDVLSAFRCVSISDKKSHEQDR